MAVQPLTLITPRPMRPYATFVFSFWLKDANGNPISLTGYKPAMSIVPNQAPQTPIDLTVENGRASIIQANGHDWFMFKVPNDITAQQTWEDAAFNVLIQEPSGDVIEYVNGTIPLLPALSKSP